MQTGPILTASPLPPKPIYSKFTISNHPSIQIITTS
nr:MAG TPA: hypothetical protein [Caudoviricetes sp.]